jgi:hypothetical protein
MRRQCPCGNYIRLRDSICKDCREKYGNDSEQWPGWFSFLVKQEQSDIDRQRRRDFDLPFEDEYFLPETTNKQNTAQPEKDFEDMLWDNQ